MKSILLTLSAIVISYSYAANKFAGPFLIQVQQPFICEDEGTKDLYFHNTTVRKKAKNFYAVTTRIISKIEFSDDVMMRVNFAVWGNGGWRPNFLTMDYKKACSAFAELLPGVFNEVLVTNNITGCPTPPGDYSIVDADGSPKVGLTSLPYNRYKIYIMFLSQDGTLLGCLGMITNVVPKERRG
uniref:MD-2-related lipid-recognition domain-containing protein n=2 Tax=Lygus hesperus TaxID=30085 RepID=A0A0K8SGL2_LYGHE